MVTKVAQVSGLVKRGIENPDSAFPEIRKMAADADWEVREVAATALVEISKKRADEVVREMIRWAKGRDPNVRRTSSEGLRDVARRDPKKVLPVIEALKADENLYVRSFDPADAGHRRPWGPLLRVEPADHRETACAPESSPGRGIDAHATDGVAMGRVPHAKP